MPRVLHAPDSAAGVPGSARHQVATSGGAGDAAPDVIVENDKGGAWRAGLALALVATTLTSCLIEEPESCNYSETRAPSADECFARWSGCWAHRTYGVSCSGAQCACTIDGQSQSEFRRDDACTALEQDRQAVHREHCGVDIETTLDPEVVMIEHVARNALLWCLIGLVLGALALVLRARRRVIR